MLVREYEEFERNTKKAIEMVEKQEAIMKRRNLNELHDFADNLTQETLAPKLTFRVETTEQFTDQSVDIKINQLLNNVNVEQLTQSADDLLV